MLPLTHWQLHNAHAEDDSRLLPLFAQVFGHSICAEEWAWKYQANPLRGCFLTAQGQPVAFFGGMERRFSYKGQTYRAVQNGDVMVHPSQRGVFTRRGALYQVASRFFNEHVGAGRGYAFAFGFPNTRHMRLGLKLGLYRQAGQMQQLFWPYPPLQVQAATKAHWLWYSQEQVMQAAAPNLPLSDLDILWPQMQASWRDYFLPERGAERWRYRYGQRPGGAQYQLIVLRQRWSAKPLAALALRLHPDHCHWLDYLGSLEQLPRAITAARAFAQKHQLPLKALVSDCVAASFAQQGAQVQPSEIAIPTNAMPIDAVSSADAWLGRLWLMGGDSDFM